ncbi:hypothetical protein AAHA92_10961 [Salvia divinorum]|uniref:Reverse transcriptase Ty1/copia-type domain-containing protein n=1 Tax=Salvia divinorum TaxID=28513 RepID=A0ABD1HY89_SALDI
MDEEIQAIEKNDAWSLTMLPEGRKAIGVKWVLKTKKNVNGEVQRLFISLASQHNWKIYQLDVKSAFLNGFLEEEIYVEQ